MYIGPVKEEKDLHAILALQQQNLPRNINNAEVKTQGFVTVEHDIDLLREMNNAYPHTIARDGEYLAGYALVMLPQFRHRIPVLVPLFERFEQLTWHGRPVESTQWFLMGQVCVNKAYRGQGVFAAMYRDQQQRLAKDYELILTEISARNHRSLRAHEKVGFEVLEHYKADGETWVVVGLETLR